MAANSRKPQKADADCAGILFRVRTKGPLFLLLKRSDTGEWCQPCGHIEQGESIEEAAVRECVEEIGGCPEGIRWVAKKTPLSKGSGTFTCFLQDVPEPFKPILNGEHTRWGWFSPGQLPNHMHPDVERTIRSVTGNELDIAKRIATGELPSPQRYENMWLFDVRITGTGTSYRSTLDEFVYRPPENYLTEEFRQRCNGLPVIFLHPEKTLLNTVEYRERNIGSVFYPYIKGDEVRGVAKVFDDDGAQLMLTSHASTSPAVVFRDAGSTETVQLEDGSTVLIEGKPSLLDHLAICEEGVWDKGGEPTGVNIEGDPAVDETNETTPAWADALIKRCDEMHARLDAMEGKGEGRKDEEHAERKDEHLGFEGLEKKVEGEGYGKESAEKIAGKVAAEKRGDSESEAKKEGEGEKKEEHKAAEALKEAEKDGAKEREAEERADAQSRTIRELQSQLAAVNARVADLTKPRTNEDRDQLARIQRRAESVAMAFGDSNAVTPPMYDESPSSYKRRMAAVFQKHSPRAKSANLKALDDATFGVIEDMIYADAQSVANTAATLPKGKLNKSVDNSTGHQVTTYTGDPDACWGMFKAPVFTGRINKTPGKRVN